MYGVSRISWTASCWWITLQIKVSLSSQTWSTMSHFYLKLSWFKPVAGFLVLAPDYFRGVNILIFENNHSNSTRIKDPVNLHRKHRLDRTTDPSFDYEAWKMKHMTFASENVPNWTNAVINLYGKSWKRYYSAMKNSLSVPTTLGGPSTRYHIVGYCFGAPFVMDALKNETVFCA